MNKTLLKDRSMVEGLTIDGSDSRDLDDAFWLESVAEGYILHISITDVGAEIAVGSDLDQAAQKKCFTRYMRHGNDPMLPHDYSEQSLSLLADKQRLTLTVSIPIDEYGQSQAPTIRKTVLKSKAKLTYQQADKIMASPEHPWHEMLNHCHILSKALFQQRQNNGAIALYNLKKGLITSEDGSIQTLSADESYNSHILIQEFMILVNEVVARFFAEQQIPALYRNHTSKAVAPERNTVLEDVNYALAIGDQERISTLIEKFTLIFNKAEYAPVIAGHYALNLPAYTHMTSPIRRYADLVNIRQLSAFISGETLPYTQAQLVLIGEQINTIGLKYRKDQEKYFKKAKFHKRLKLLNEDEFLLTEEHNFSKMLNVAIASNQLPPTLLAEINSRLVAGELTPREVFAILLQTQVSEAWLSLKSRLLHQMAQQLYMATSVITIAVQKLHWQAIKYDTRQIDASPAKFFTTASTQIKDKPFVSISQKTLPNGISNKKISQQLANLSLLANIIEIDLDIATTYAFQEEDCGILDNTHLESPIEKTSSTHQPNINYVGKLVELYQQKGWNAPEYEYSQKGLAHQPLFLMQAHITIGDKLYSSDEKASSNKKMVKQLAAANLIDKIAHLSAEISPPPSKQPKENFIGRLNNRFQQQQLDLPHYRFDYSEDKMSHLGQFKCICVVVDHQGHSQEAIAYGSSKKAAKYDVAKIMWDTLKQSQ